MSGQYNSCKKDKSILIDVKFSSISRNKRPRSSSSGSSHSAKRSRLFDSTDRYEGRRPRLHSYESQCSSSSRGSSHYQYPKPRKQVGWKYLKPSEVKGFQCGGPTVFIQNISCYMKKRQLYNCFKNFGGIVDIQIVEVERKRTACIVFSRQAEADSVFEINKKN